MAGKVPNFSKYFRSKQGDQDESISSFQSSSILGREFQWRDFALHYSLMLLNFTSNSWTEEQKIQQQREIFNALVKKSQIWELIKEILVHVFQKNDFFVKKISLLAWEIFLKLTPFLLSCMICELSSG